jgi:tRNA nucleotidyltransferase (CCA-adding enzyme)
MPEYTYLLETRLSAAQKHALAQVRDAAREAGMVVFLAGGAVRDLTTGSSVRDLDFAVQGNALKLQSALESRGATLWGKHEPSRSLFLWFPGSVRVEVSSTRSEAFPKPGKPVYTWSGIVDDLYRRDFTVNAMALSLNEGSYGLLLDPLNGVADTEARQLRLVSNYGFIEDPARLLRAVRLSRRMGWSLEERTEARYQNAKEADNFGDISEFLRGYELEEIASEEDSLATLKAYEDEGWMQKLMPGWTAGQADTAAVDALHRVRIQLLMQGIAPDLTIAHLELLTAKMKPEHKKAFQQAMVRPGLLAAWEGLDAAAKDFGKVLTSKEMAVPSAAWKLFHSHAAEPILWLAFTGKGAAEAKFKQLFTVWPEVAKKVPVAMMTELRITPDLPVYEELLHELFLQQIDGKLETDEQMRAFLETYSPPAPPPPVSLKRSRSKKSAPKGKRKGAAREADDDHDDDPDDDREEPEDLPDLDLDDASDAPEAGDSLDAAEDADGDSDEDDAPRKQAQTSPAKAAPAPKKSVAQPPAVKSAAEAKPAAASVREKAASGSVNLDGVDLGAMLDRIQAAGSRSKASSKSAPAKTSSRHEAALTAAESTVETAAAKHAAKPVPLATAKTALKPVAADKAAATSVAKPAAGKKAAPVKAVAPAKKAAEKPAAVAAKKGGSVSAAAKPPVKTPGKAPGKTAAKVTAPASKQTAKAAPVKQVPAKKKTSPAPAKKNIAVKAAPAKAAKPAAKVVAKPATKAPAKKAAKSPAKPAKKTSKR